MSNPIHVWQNQANSFASDDFIPVDGETEGSRKMGKDTLLGITSNTALAGKVASEFNSSKTGGYAVGDLVIYQGALYKCTTVHTGAWNSSNFTSTTLDQEMGRNAYLTKVVNAITSQFNPSTACVAGKLYWYDGDLYKCNTTYTGAWDSSKFTATTIDAELRGILGYTTDVAHNFAPEFDSTVAYTKGQFVTYQGKIYQFTSDHSAGAWNASHATVSGQSALLKMTAQNALAGNIAPEFDPTRTSENPYKAGESVVYNGVLYIANHEHYGAWESTHFAKIDEDTLTRTSTLSFMIEFGKKLDSEGNTRTDFNWYIIKGIKVKKGDVIECSLGLIDSTVEVRLVNSSGARKAHYNFSSQTRSFVAGSNVDELWMPLKNLAYQSAYVKVNGLLVFNSATCTFYNFLRRSVENDRNIAFIGNGSTYSCNYYWNLLIPGRKYRLDLFNYGYASVQDTPPNSFKFLLRAYDSSNNVTGDLVKIYMSGSVNSSYEVTVPTNTSYVEFGGRIAKGEVVAATITDLSILDDLNKQINKGISEHLVIPLSLINSSVSSGYPIYDSSTTRVCSEDIVLWPVLKGTYKVHSLGNMQISTTCFNSAGSTTHTTPWTGDGSTFTILDNPSYAYRISFRHSDDSDITVDEIKTAIADGSLFVEVIGVQEVNYESSLQLNAAASTMKKLVRGDNLFQYLPTFVHISDVHGDITRLANSRKVAELIKADALVNSGDSVMYKSVNGCAFVNMFGDEIIPEIFCLGNHESYPTGVTGLFDKFISPLVTANGYEKSSGVATDNCYYFRDFSVKKIRMIVLNYYNNGVYAGSLGQSQLDWFADTLASTPEGYGVIVVLHSPEDKVVCPEEYAKFRQSVRVTTYQENGFYIGDRPVMNIIDGFISKTSGNESYTDNGVSVSVDYDFTSLNNGVEFICYMAGHRHEDWIGYYDHSTNMQLCLGITTGNAINVVGTNHAFANQSDLGRNDGVGTPQDALNVYSIDRSIGKVKVVRIGADLTTSFEKRDYMEIPYKEVT